MNIFASRPQFLRAQFQRQLVTGAVIKLKEKMDDGKVQEKRFVVLMVADRTFCSVINSEINPFIQKRPALLKCQVFMPVADHSFMSWDSHIDCVGLKAYSTDHILDEMMTKTGFMLGQITLSVRDDIISALKHSPALSVAEVAELSASLQAMQ
jgi:hypothetical protein